MSYEITGKIKSIGEAEEYGSNGFRKREVVLLVNGEYPQVIKFEAHNKVCDNLPNYQKVDDLVKVKFDIRGREHEGNVYNNLVAFRFETIGAVEEVAEDNTGDDLPF